MGDEPEAPLDFDLRLEHGRQPWIVPANEIGQNPYPRALRDHAMLNVDAGAAQLRFKPRLHFAQIVEFGGEDEFRHITDQRMVA